MALLVWLTNPENRVEFRVEFRGVGGGLRAGALLLNYTKVKSSKLKSSKGRSFFGDGFWFLKRALCSPKTVGAVWPSSPGAAELMASQVKKHLLTYPGYVVEVGAGTGSFTQALAQVLPPERLLCLEIDPILVERLKENFPQLAIFRGDARCLSRWMPPGWQGQVSAVVSTIPMRNLCQEDIDQILKEGGKVLSDQGDFFQLTYGRSSPFAKTRMPVHSEKIGNVWRNIPPCTLWQCRIGGKV